MTRAPHTIVSPACCALHGASWNTHVRSTKTYHCIAVAQLACTKSVHALIASIHLSKVTAAVASEYTFYLSLQFVVACTQAHFLVILVLVHIFVTEAGLLFYCGRAFWGALRPPIAVAGYSCPEGDHPAVTADEAAAAAAATAMAVAAASMQQAV